MYAKTWTTALLLSVSFGIASASAQEAAEGEWRCEYDRARTIPQSVPRGAALVERISFAPRSSGAEVALVKGGPKGFFIFVHLHAIHNGRSGSSDYKVSAFLQDESEYNYTALPVLSATVTGAETRPDRHRHCSGQFLIPAESIREIREALANGAQLKLVVLGERKYRDYKDFVLKGVADVIREAAMKYLQGSPIGEVLKQMNQGKSPFKK